MCRFYGHVRLYCREQRGATGENCLAKARVGLDYGRAACLVSTERRVNSINRRLTIPSKTGRLHCALVIAVTLASCGGRQDSEATGSGGTGTERTQSSGPACDPIRPECGMRSIGVPPTMASGGSGGSSGSTKLINWGVAAAGTSGSSEPSTAPIVACDEAARSYCITDCFLELSPSDLSTCVDGNWTCRAGYFLASSCPADACRVALDRCCDGITGVSSQRICGDDGYRPPCPEGTRATLNWFCIPDALAISDCMTLNGKICSGPETNCSSFERMGADCSCNSFDGSETRWHCFSYIGP